MKMTSFRHKPVDKKDMLQYNSIILLFFNRNTRKMKKEVGRTSPCATLSQKAEFKKTWNYMENGVFPA
jgi:hypothetical protein